MQVSQFGYLIDGTNSTTRSLHVYVFDNLMHNLIQEVYYWFKKKKENWLILKWIRIKRLLVPKELLPLKTLTPYLSNKGNYLTGNV